ncbi:hypothetical protein [Microbulbifer halophilus]|uniref:hypothetical protein n=1 Tax=Microbulbifer halophilus TaxID=453963 RepID=UPI002244C8DC|nr:hypothetical protein [Microbulbifer halophilus]
MALLTACSVQTARSEAVPALLVSPDPSVHAVLERTVSQALNGASANLADDALTRQSNLIVERRPLRSLQEPGGLHGRKLEKPEKFRLMTDGAECWLLKSSDGSRWPLPGVRCVPEA